MKILVINHEECYLDVINLTKEEEAFVESQDDFYDAAEQLIKEKGFFTQNPCIQWMIADPDIPVYVHGEAIPFISL